MRVNELAQELQTTSTILIELLGDPETKSPLNGLDQKQEAALRKVVEEKRGNGELPILGKEDTESNIDELMKELADTKALQGIQEELNDKQQERIAELEEELNLLGGSPAADTKIEPEDVAKEIEKLKKGKSETELSKMLHSMRCQGVKSEYWGKYNLLLQRK